MNGGADVEAERVAPHNLEAERAVLGACLIRPELYLSVADLPTEAFFRHGHRLVWQQYAALDAEGLPLDMVALLDRLTKARGLEAAGGAAYLAGLIDGVPRSTNVGYYAGIVREAWQRRKLIAQGEALIAQAYDADDTPARVAARGAARLESAVEVVDQTAVSAGDLVSAAGVVRSGAELDATPTAPLAVSWPALARYVSYWRPGDYIVIGGRPSDGKSSLALQIAMDAARTVARAGLPGEVLFVSCEMSPEDIWSRALAVEGRIPFARVRERYFGRDDGLALVEALARIRDLPLVVEDGSDWRISDVSRAARLRARQGGVALIVVDYLQLLSADTRRENRQAEVTDISRAIKRLARALRVPVIALAQLARGEKGYKGPSAQQRPKLSDLRESGAIEQDADVVLLLHRPAGSRGARADVREVIVAKQRNGPIGLAKLAFLPQFTAFASLDTAHADEGG